MAVLVDKNTRLVVQGITGSAGGFHTRQCMDYGTNVVAGVTTGRGVQKFDDKVPVFDTVAEARAQTGCNVSMIFVPAAGAADSILEAVDAGVELFFFSSRGRHTRYRVTGVQTCALPIFTPQRVLASRSSAEFSSWRTRWVVTPRRDAISPRVDGRSAPMPKRRQTTWRSPSGSAATARRDRKSVV